MGEKNEGIKYDQHKIRTDLTPYDAVMEITKVLTFGAKKYAARNWEKGMSWSRAFGALMRHMWLWFHGEDKDPETRLSHLANAGCCLFFLISWELRKVGTDDRPKLDPEVLKGMSSTEFMDGVDQLLKDLAEKQKAKENGLSSSPN